MAKKSVKRDPGLRAATVARVTELVKEGLTKSNAFDKIAAETGRAREAVQMLYYRALRNPKSIGLDTAPKVGRTRRRAGRRRGAAKAAPGPHPKGAEFTRLLQGLANSINAILAHVEKAVSENAALKDQAKRLEAIASLVRAR